MSQKHRGYAVITGASSGIGAEFAKRFAKEGFDLILVARRKDRLLKLCEEIHREVDKERECLLLEADLSSLEDCQKLCDFLQGKKLAIFINNAGFGDCGRFLDGDLDKELQMIDVNIRAVHFLTKKVLEIMQKQKGGYLLNVASSAGLMPAGPYMATYYASKAYVASLTRAIAEEFKEQKSPIYIGCLCPGPVKTEFDEVANVDFSLKGISAYDCANYAVDQMIRGKKVIVPTLKMKLAMVFGRFLPQSLYIRIAAHQQRKKMEANRDSE